MSPEAETALERARANAVQAEANRLAMPVCTAFVDDMRAAFGEVRVVYAEENGVVRGKRGPAGVEATQT